MSILTPKHIVSFHKIIAQIAKFMGPTWGQPGSCRPQMDPRLAPWTLLSGCIVCMLQLAGRNELIVSTELQQALISSCHHGFVGDETCPPIACRIVHRVTCLEIRRHRSRRWLKIPNHNLDEKMLWNFEYQLRYWSSLVEQIPLNSQIDTSRILNCWRAKRYWV